MTHKHDNQANIDTINQNLSTTDVILINNAHGELYEDNDAGSTSIVIATPATYVGWVTSSSVYNSGAPWVTRTANATADRLTLGTSGAGRYHIVSVFTISSSVSTVVRMAVFKTGARLTNCEAYTTVATTGNLFQQVVIGYNTVVATAYFDVRFTADAATTLSVYHGSLNILRINN